jgi:hypothetical protein
VLVLTYMRDTLTIALCHERLRSHGSQLCVCAAHDVKRSPESTINKTLNVKGATH